MLELDVVEARVRKYIEESYIIDKQLKKRTIKFEMYVIVLEDKNPFNYDKFVKIARKKFLTGFPNI